MLVSQNVSLGIGFRSQRT